MPELPDRLADAIDSEARNRAGDSGSVAAYRMQVIAELRAALPDLVSEAGLAGREEGMSWSEIAMWSGYATARSAAAAIDETARMRHREHARKWDARNPRLQADVVDAPGITARQAAELLGVSAQTVRRRAAAGKLQSTTHNGVLRIVDPSIWSSASED